MRMKILLALCLGPPTAAASDCATSAAATHRVAVLELYTSEGCSSCPPADRWLRALAPRDDLALVAFHVDYWDRLGWKDPWSDPRFSARQHARAARAGARVVYTPDVVFDGRSRNDWARGWSPAPAGEPAPFGLTASAAVGATGLLQVQWSARDAPAGSEAWLAVTQSGLSSVPKRGENGGVHLAHDHVARRYAAGLAATGGSHALPLPPDLGFAQARLVVVVEDTASARPLQALSMSLAACRPTH